MGLQVIETAYFIEDSGVMCLIKYTTQECVYLLVVDHFSHGVSIYKNNISSFNDYFVVEELLDKWVTPIETDLYDVLMPQSEAQPRIFDRLTNRKTLEIYDVAIFTNN